MGWGDLGGITPAGTRQGDLGAGVLRLSLSQEITQRSIERSSAVALAEAARAFLASGTTADRRALSAALIAHDGARNAAARPL